jgi:integral membrane protein
MTNSVKKFGLINTVEGYSYLVLLFIAMPLKYIFHYEIAVKIVGMTHGILFILFLVLLIEAWKNTKWAFSETLLFFIASLIPFGTFYTKKRIKSYE